MREWDLLVIVAAGVQAQKHEQKYVSTPVPYTYCTSMDDKAASPYNTGNECYHQDRKYFTGRITSKDDLKRVCSST